MKGWIQVTDPEDGHETWLRASDIVAIEARHTDDTKPADQSGVGQCGIADWHPANKPPETILKLIAEC
jgi:hypothetical protein